MNGGPPTRAMALCLAAIRRLTVGDVPPTLEEIRLDMGMCSRGNVHNLLCRMEERGLISRLPRASRSIRIIPDPVDYQVMSDAALAAMAEGVAAEMARRAACDLQAADT